MRGGVNLDLHGLAGPAIAPAHTKHNPVLSLKCGGRLMHEFCSRRLNTLCIRSMEQIKAIDHICTDLQFSLVFNWEP